MQRSRPSICLSFTILFTACGGGPGPQPPPSLGVCGTGSWRPGALEIHHLAVGQADATLIIGPTGRTLLVDAGETSWEATRGADTVAAALDRVLGCRALDQVVITHFHLDHVGGVGRGGLWRLVEALGVTVGVTLHRDLRSFVGQASGTLLAWRGYLEGAGRARLRPQPVQLGSGQVDLGPGVAFRVVAADGNGLLRRGDLSRTSLPPNENDYSVAAVLRFGAFDYFIGGDLSGEHHESDHGYRTHDIETVVARAVGDVDVLRASHHGSDHSSNPTFLAQVDPEVSIVSVGEGNPFGHPRAPALARLGARGPVFLTERGAPRARLGDAIVAGPVVVRAHGGETYTVNDRTFRATDPPRIDRDGDGYFQEADPDDADPHALPAPHGCQSRPLGCP